MGVGTTTPNALLQVAGTASVSGQLTLYGTPTIQSTANQTLTLGGNTTGFMTLQPWGGSGQVTIDTTDYHLGSTLTVNGSIRSTGTGMQVGDTLANNYEGSFQFDANPDALNPGVFNTSLLNIFRIRLGGVTGPSGFGISDYNNAMRLWVARSGNVSIGTTSALATFDVRANQYTTPVASFSGQTGKATLIVDNSGAGDLFTASSSGLPRFVITQAGNVGYWDNVPRETRRVLGRFSVLMGHGQRLLMHGFS